MFPKPKYCQAFLYCIWLSPSSECLHFKPAVCLFSISRCRFVEFLNILINTAAPLASTDVCNNVNKFSWFNMQCLQQWHLDAPWKRANGNFLLWLQGAKLWEGIRKGWMESFGYGTKISSHTQERDGVCELIIQEKLYKKLHHLFLLFFNNWIYSHCSLMGIFASGSCRVWVASYCCHYLATFLFKKSWFGCQVGVSSSASSPFQVHLMQDL